MALDFFLHPTCTLSSARPTPSKTPLLFAQNAPAKRQTCIVVTIILHAVRLQMHLFELTVNGACTLTLTRAHVNERIYSRTLAMSSKAVASTSTGKQRKKGATSDVPNGKSPAMVRTDKANRLSAALAAAPTIGVECSSEEDDDDASGHTEDAPGTLEPTDVAKRVRYFSVEDGSKTRVFVVGNAVGIIEHH